MTGAAQDRAPGGVRDRAAGHGGGAAARSVVELYQVLGAAARRSASELEVGDVEMIVDLAAAQAARERRSGGARPAGGGPAEVAEMMGAAVEASGSRCRAVWPAHVGAADWSGFGTVIPTLAGSPGAGSSSIAAAVADIVYQDRRCCLLVDADDPARSGLTQAAAVEGPWTRAVSDQVQVRYSWRGRPGRGVLVARLDTTLPGITPGMVPAPPDWIPQPRPDPLHVTVADLGHNGWRAAGSPIAGAGGWLRAGHPAPRPILVVRATRPSLRQAEQVLTRLETWVQAGVAAPVAQLVVCAAKKWPSGIDGTAGPRISRLLDDAVFVPPVTTCELDGVTADATPVRALDALRPLLASWGVIAPLAGSAAARRGL